MQQDIIEVTPNGQSFPTPPLTAPPAEASPKLPMGALRRLWRLQGLLERASEGAQAAVNAHTTRRTAYQGAFEAACEDAGVQIPPGDHDVNIDWTTGDVRFTPR